MRSSFTCCLSKQPRSFPVVALTARAAYLPLGTLYVNSCVAVPPASGPHAGRRHPPRMTLSSGMSRRAVRLLSYSESALVKQRPCFTDDLGVVLGCMIWVVLSLTCEADERSELLPQLWFTL